jgi:hypothetical protein
MCSRCVASRRIAAFHVCAYRLADALGVFARNPDTCQFAQIFGHFGKRLLGPQARGLVLQARRARGVEHT